jgi:hypothetical protein
MTNSRPKKIKKPPPLRSKSSALDPRIDAADRSRGQTAHLKMIIDACRLRQMPTPERTAP